MYALSANFGLRDAIQMARHDAMLHGTTAILWRLKDRWKGPVAAKLISTGGGRGTQIIEGDGLSTIYAKGSWIIVLANDIPIHQECHHPVWAQLIGYFDYQGRYHTGVPRQLDMFSGWPFPDPINWGQVKKYVLQNI